MKLKEYKFKQNAFLLRGIIPAAYGEWDEKLDALLREMDKTTIEVTLRIPDNES